MISTFLVSAAAFIVAIGVMITVHEYGHYWVARRFDVKVLRFSVGFGKPLLRWTRGPDRTEFVVAAIPLGGYVKMLDEREGEVSEAEAERAFNRKSVAARSAIVAAGPVINILLAVVCYWAMFVTGITGLVPNIGAVEPESPAAEAGFRQGEQIVRVGNRDTRTWTDVRLAFLDAGLGRQGRQLEVAVEDRAGARQPRRLDVSSVSLRDAEEDPLGTLGFRQWFPEMPAEIGDVVADSPAERAGLVAGDRILEADGEAVDDWIAWVEFVRERPGETFPVRVARDGSIRTVELTPDAVTRGDQTLGQIGAYGPSISEADRERMFTTVRFGPLAATGEAVTRTWEITTLTVRVIGQLITGQAALANISGPVTIAQFAGESAQSGLAQFLGFIALISISIGLLNLLPIPVLDGGHLLYFAIEAIKGSPLSEQAQIIGQQIGIVMIFALIALALYNDFLRLVH